MTDSYVTSQQVNGANRINLTGASPDFTRDEFLAHVQARVNHALNSYADDDTQKAALGIEKLQFTRANGATIDTIYETNDIINLHIHQMHMSHQAILFPLFQQLLPTNF